MNVTRVASKMIKADLWDEAGQLLDYASQVEEREARGNATEYELNWLLGHLHRSARATDIGPTEDDGGLPIITALREPPTGGHDQRAVEDQHRSVLFIVDNCPRLHSLLYGQGDDKLPSLAAFRAGRTP